MTAAPSPRHPATGLAADIAAACELAAPVWPLDRMIAVNPYLGLADLPTAQADAALAALCGSRLTMPGAWYLGQWRRGCFSRGHLARALDDAGANGRPDEVLSVLASRPVATADPVPLVTGLLDSQEPPAGGWSWAELVVDQLSQFCAGYFEPPSPPDGGLYPAWRQAVARDRRAALLMGLEGFPEAVQQLPATPEELIEAALDGLRVPAARRRSYLSALLLDINGWAGWCARRRWEARLAGGDDHALVDLLAARLAWEWLLHDHAPRPELGPRWRRALVRWPDDPAPPARPPAVWLAQHALEIAYQQPLVEGLLAAPPGPAPEPPEVQAVFCIDVRSEVLRRHLERAAPQVQTLGFAGFFGLAAEYTPLGCAEPSRRLPGLLHPVLRIRDTGGDEDAIAAGRRAGWAAGAAWQALRNGPVSAFPYVEATGLAYAGALLAASLPGTGGAGPANPCGGSGIRPRLALEGADAARQGAELAAGVLRAMSLTRGLAPLVVLLGHGSHSRNNPHAATLDCGACGGQAGDVNARALASLLNDPRVRAELRGLGIQVPEQTWFLAGLHDTTTDQVTLFNTGEAPATHGAAIRRLQQGLAGAADGARTERATRLGVKAPGRRGRLRALLRRGRDWSEVRPEWGLAGNAAFIAAPRGRTAHLDLAGRAFLHEYRWQDDPEGAVLEQILTAPLVVAHWINMQYYASTVDNRRFGSGNKVLHNVVGGGIGVLEGNGGDLRVGLPLQSLHDGRDWVHMPLRLSAFVEAPPAAIERVLADHPEVRRPADNGWLHLFRIDAEAGRVWHYRPGGWRPAPGDLGAAAKSAVQAWHSSDPQPRQIRQASDAAHISLAGPTP